MMINRYKWIIYLVSSVENPSQITAGCWFQPVSKMLIIQPFQILAGKKMPETANLEYLFWTIFLGPG